ncbi:hypothetical protein DXD59_00670 [Olsenella sp. TM06-36]|uniref:hypothetical protein n=1 Tax=unclassified Olsenella TaxID=2638792 RepID=UPI000E440BAF|nr:MULTISPECIES: hypothetical protein [unclassified Olsenella]RGJ47443.1 hypothetical protein DXD59_00670 [Olsenella sp. TM06-36]RHJ96140.1 hypothetical protein DW092_00665 [Olsenella sp. AM05-7]RHK00426.1 hypothetical protein DW090_01455 [Olsenella sp. AM05-17]
MSSSDRRREVAAMLRAYPLELAKAEHKGKDPLQLPADVMYDLMDIAGVGEDFDSLLPSLADLIDPTCHVIPGKEAVAELNDGTRLTGVLLSCGHAAFGVVPEFCSGCGARVTNKVGDD